MAHYTNTNLLQLATTDKLPLVKCNYCNRPVLFALRARHLLLCSVIGASASKARKKLAASNPAIDDTSIDFKTQELSGATALKAPPAIISLTDTTTGVGDITATPPVAKQVRKRKRKDALSTIDTSELLSGADNISITSGGSSATKVRQKKSKTKIPYDPEIHCGVPNEETNEPCTRAITCKMHTVKAKRLVNRGDNSYDALVKSYQLNQQRSRHGNNLTSPLTGISVSQSPAPGHLGFPSLNSHPLLGHGALLANELAPFGGAGDSSSLLPVSAGQLVGSDMALDLNGRLSDAAVAVKLMYNVANAKRIFETKEGAPMASQVLALFCDPITGHLDSSLVRSLPIECQKLLIVHYLKGLAYAAKDSWRPPFSLESDIGQRLLDVGVDSVVAHIQWSCPEQAPLQRFGVSCNGFSSIAEDAKTSKHLRYLLKSYPESELMLKALEKHEPFPLALPPGYAGVASYSGVTGTGRNSFATPYEAEAVRRSAHTTNVKDSLDALSKHLLNSENLLAQKHKTTHSAKQIGMIDVRSLSNHTASPPYALPSSSLSPTASSTNRAPEVAVAGAQWWAKCTSRGALSEILRAQRNSIRT